MPSDGFRDPTKAREVSLDNRAKRAVTDSAKLRWAARIVREARRRGLVDVRGNVIEQKPQLGRVDDDERAS
jgi:hypothetical protein